MSFNIIKLHLLIKLSLFLGTGCFFIPQALANNNSEIIQKALEKKLYEKELWLKLVHYEDTLFGRLESPIKSKDFFFAKDGRTNPKNELISTIKAFDSNEEYKSQDLHPQCRFIARKMWIKKELNLKSNIWSDKKCPKFSQWSHNNKVKSISLIFATGYLGNPASFFGHPLLKFNVNPTLEKNNLLDYSLNYGALTGDNDDPISYSLKGLFGGYNAAFTHIQFFYHNHNYSETELRDMWEYRLNFSQEEVDLIVRHAWEMLGREITYFFTQDNCALRMGELLNLVVKEDILPKNVPYAIPHTLFDRIAHMQRINGEKLVSEIKYIPSRQTKLTSKYKKLSQSEKELVQSIIRDNQLIESKRFKSTSFNSKVKVTNTLVDYSMFVLASDKENKKLKKMRKKFLIARAKLPMGKVDKSEAQIQPIHKGQRPVLTRLSVGNWREGKPFYDFEVRPAYYDLLTPDTGRLPYSSLAIGRLEVRKIEDQFIIRELDFFNVSAFNLAQTDLPGDGSFAWKFKLGISSQALSCDTCQVANMKMGFGHAYELSKRIVPYYFIGPVLTSSLNEFGTTGSQSDLGAIVTFSESYRLLINKSFIKFYNELRTYQETFEVDQRFGSFRTWDIRLGYKYQNSSEYKLSYTYYW